MSFKGDFDEAKEFWRDASNPARALIVLSVFLSVSSVASLSDVIVDWKGFIRDGLAFFQAWVTGPLSRALGAVFNLDLSQKDTDVLVVVGFLYFSMARELVMDVLASGRRSPRARFFMYAYPAMCLLMWLSVAWGLRGSWEPPLWPVAGLLIVFLALPIVAGRTLHFNRVVYYGPIVIAVGTVLILGAINAGLSR